MTATLSINTHAFQHSNSFVHVHHTTSHLTLSVLLPQFDNVTGQLTILGEATVDVYSSVLEQITYFNRSYLLHRQHVHVHSWRWMLEHVLSSEKRDSAEDVYKIMPPFCPLIMQYK